MKMERANVHNTICIHQRLLALASFFFIIINSTSARYSSALNLEDSSNTLTVGQGARLVSQNGLFVLGLLSFGSPPVPYLCIWYNLTTTEDRPSVVWTAREQYAISAQALPNASLLVLNEDGNLIISNGTGDHLWSSQTGGKTVTKAELLNTGNFVLSTSTSESVWESFSFPLNTLLPSQAFSTDPHGETAELNSWINETSPLPGGCFLAMQGDQNLVIYSNILGNHDPIWASGTQINGVPRRPPYAELDDIGTFTIHYSDQSNLTLSKSYRSSLDHGKANVARRVVLDPDGSLRMYSWNPAQRNWLIGWNSSCSGGCTVNKTANHSPPPSTGIVEPGNHSPPPSTRIVQPAGNRSPLPSIGNMKPGNHSRSLIYTFAALGALVLVALVIVAFLARGKIRHFMYPLPFHDLGIEISEIRAAWSGPPLPVQFQYSHLKTSTNSFSEKLGSGGFGSVYKGVLRDKRVVAVKRLENLSSSHGDKGFVAEVLTIGVIHHMNLVRLHGYCSDGPERRLLVYEFLENGSLDKYLFAESETSCPAVLDWPTRLNIAVGTAKGIAYFHEQCRERILHCDIKPENILLDRNFCPKVSDFGLAKLMSKDQTYTITNVRGTRGYMAPEWSADGPITVKADVFSYGKMLLEIISGRRNLSTSTSMDRLYYPSWAFRKMMLGNSAEVVDEKLGGEYELAQVESVLHVAFWCIQDEPRSRPSMGRVVEMLEGKVPVFLPPLPKALALLMTEASSATTTLDGCCKDDGSSEDSCSRLTE